jgi:hypothetical protein
MGPQTGSEIDIIPLRHPNNFFNPLLKGRTILSKNRSFRGYMIDTYHCLSGKEEVP